MLNQEALLLVSLDLRREKESRKQASQNPTGKVPFGVFRPEARVAALETGFPPPCQAPARRAPKVEVSGAIF